MIWHSVVRCSVVRHSVVQHYVVQHSLVWQSVVRHTVVRDSVIQHSAVRHSVVRHFVAVCSKIQYTVVRHSVVRHSVVRCSVVRCSVDRRSMASPFCLTNTHCTVHTVHSTHYCYIPLRVRFLSHLILLLGHHSWIEIFVVFQQSLCIFSVNDYLTPPPPLSPPSS